MLSTILIIIGLVLAVIAMIQSKAQSLIAWAVICLAAALLIGTKIL